MSAVVTVALPVFALIAIGSLARWFQALGDGATVALNQFVMLLALPAVMFQAMAGIPLGEFLDWRLFLAYLLPTFAVGGLAFAIAFRNGYRLGGAAIHGLSASFANVGYMGIPLCLTAFGRAALVPSIITLIVTTVFQFGTALTLVEAGAQPDGGKWRAMRKAFATLARNPLLIAPLAGLAWAQSGLGLAPPVDKFLALLGGSATPCALVAVGLQVAQTGQRFPAGLVLWFTFLKLIVHPALAWLIAVPLLHLPPIGVATVVLMSATPTGSSAFVLARLYDREVAACSGAVLVSTLLSFATLSLLLAWFTPLP